MEKKYKIDIESQKLAKKLAKKRSLVKMQEPLADYDLKQLAGGKVNYMPPEKVLPLSKGRELKPEKLEVKKANVALFDPAKKRKKEDEEVQELFDAGRTLNEKDLDLYLKNKRF